MRRTAGNDARELSVEDIHMLWLIEAIIGIGFLVSVAISVEAAANRQKPTSF